MVFGLGAPWTDTTPGSVSKLNRVTVISGPGTDLAGLTKSLHVLYKCTETGSGLIIDHVYQTSTDGTSLIDLSSIDSHAHTSSTTGGELMDIFSANPKFIDTGSRYLFNTAVADWQSTIGAGAAVTLDTDGTTLEKSIKLSTGATSGTECNIRLNALTLDFSKRSQFQTKLRINDTTSFAFHTGVNADDVTAVDSNTAKYNAEVCTATNNNWFLRSATGSAKTTSDSGIAITANRVAVRLEHYPTAAPARVDMQIDANTLFQKTTDIPITGTGAVNNLIKHSLKNSVAADRVVFQYGTRVRYTTNDNWV